MCPSRVTPLVSPLCVCFFEQFVSIDMCVDECFRYPFLSSSWQSSFGPYLMSLFYIFLMFFLTSLSLNSCPGGRSLQRRVKQHGGADHGQYCLPHSLLVDGSPWWVMFLCFKSSFCVSSLLLESIVSLCCLGLETFQIVSFFVRLILCMTIFHYRSDSDFPGDYLPLGGYH